MVQERITTCVDFKEKNKGMYGRLYPFLAQFQVAIFIFCFLKADLWRNWDMNHFNFILPSPDSLFHTSVFSIP